MVTPGMTYDDISLAQWAVGMSYRNQPTEELTVKMIKMSQGAGYRGWYGIESSGREAIVQGKEILKKYLEI
jgi:L-ribulose-5-phosphate 3-epimerase